MSNFTIPKGTNRLPFEQGSQDWHSYRSNRLGATAFAKILSSIGETENEYDGGVFENIYESLDSIFNPKKWKSDYKPIHLKIGNALEPVIRDILATKYNIPCVPAVLELKDNPKVYSSYDGIDLVNKQVYEIKTTKHLNDFDKSLKYYLGQFIHEYYVAFGEITESKQIGYIFVLDKKAILMNKTGEVPYENHLFASTIYYNHHTKTFEANPVIRIEGIKDNKLEMEDNQVRILMPYSRWIDMCNDYLGLWDHIKDTYFAETALEAKAIRTKEARDHLVKVAVSNKVPDELAMMLYLTLNSGEDITELVKCLEQMI
jgi:hypothetical protein